MHFATAKDVFRDLVVEGLFAIRAELPRVRRRTTLLTTRTH
jgi:hypothetical protein